MAITEKTIDASAIKAANWRIGWIIEDLGDGSQWEIVDLADDEETMVTLHKLPQDGRVKASILMSRFN